VIQPLVTFFLLQAADHDCFKKLKLAGNYAILFLIYKDKEGSMVNTAKILALCQRMNKLGIREADIREDFIRGSGRGGQKINKTSSCVQLLHLPSGIQIKCQQTRMRELNRFLARRELCARLEERLLGAQSARQQEIEKIRRQKRRRSRRQRAAMLEAKHRHSLKKQMRRPVDIEA
jgi:protein subunit release factor B